MYFIINKQSTVALRILCRQFRTSSIIHVPRGVTNVKRRERSVGTEQETEHIQPGDLPERSGQKSSSSQKDTRPIDSVDPVILKYTNLINDIDALSKDQEKVHLTNFGSIRYDNDNVPQFHGQFDSVYGPDKTTLVDNVMLNKGIHLQDTWGFESKNGPNDQGIAVEAQTALLQEAENQIQIPQTVKPKSTHEEIRPLSESEKAFEELFGSDDASYVNEADYSISSPITSDHSPTREGGGYIDEKFFPDSIFQTQATQHNVDDMHVQHKSSPSVTAEVKKSFHTQDVGNITDLNFIDRTYFKSSLETLQENRKPTVEYSEIKDEVEKEFDRFSNEEPNTSKKETQTLPRASVFRDETSRIALEYLGLDPDSEPQGNSQVQEKAKKQVAEPDSTPKTAFEYVLKKRREAHDSEYGFTEEGEAPRPTSRSYEKLMSLVGKKSTDNITSHEMLILLKNSILYDKDDIVGLYKPYGVAMHEGSRNSHHILARFLPDLAKHLKTDALHVVHRLDVTTTGVLLLTRTKTMADTLKKMFKNQEIKKTYWAITKGIPSPMQGTINIPISEGSIDGKRRMVLRPDIDGFRGVSAKNHIAITDFRVISRNFGSALVEVQPKTGVKHQLRVHLGFGLACPVLGDHKYSHLKKLAPQRLPGDMLERLKIKQSKVRNLPIYLHSQSVLIPEINNGRNVTIKAKLPAYFNKTLSILKLNSRDGQVKYVDGKCIDE